MRPRSLAEVAKLTAAGESFDRCLANFLDEFCAAPAVEMLMEEPRLLMRESRPSGSVQDAYLAAVAEELARSRRFAIPTWTAGTSRRLRRPWFASPLGSLRAVLLIESPAAFRSRNLFVSQDALSRA
jgi:hypothetical protein